MAEVLWTPKSLKDYAKFQQRLPSSLQRLDVQDVNYRTADGPRWPR
jgi:hexosaminidase